SLLIRSKNPRRCQAENPLKLLSEFAGPALYHGLCAELARTQGASLKCEIKAVSPNPRNHAGFVDHERHRY
ncbi:hypothetical protein, partial [Bradyrhizobium liaoningense]